VPSSLIWYLLHMNWLRLAQRVVGLFLKHMIFFLLKVRRKLLLIGPLAYGYCKIEDDKKWFVQSPHNNNNKNTWNLYVIKKK